MGLMASLPHYDIIVVQHGNSFSSSDLMAWSKQSGMHHTEGLVKSSEDGSMLSFNSIPASTVGSRYDPLPCSSRVASFSLLYIQAGQARMWRGVMHFDQKLNNTIINIKPFSAKNRILLSMGRQADCKLGTFS
jgi:hypothetical protein